MSEKDITLKPIKTYEKGERKRYEQILVLEQTDLGYPVAVIHVDFFNDFGDEIYHALYEDGKQMKLTMKLEIPEE